jgi:hypothetical protein
MSIGCGGSLPPPADARRDPQRTASGAVKPPAGSAGGRLVFPGSGGSSTAPGAARTGVAAVIGRIRSVAAAADSLMSLPEADRVSPYDHADQRRNFIRGGGMPYRRTCFPGVVCRSDDVFPALPPLVSRQGVRCRQRTGSGDLPRGEAAGGCDTDPAREQQRRAQQRGVRAGLAMSGGCGGSAPPTGVGRGLPGRHARTPRGPCGCRAVRSALHQAQKNRPPDNPAGGSLFPRSGRWRTSDTAESRRQTVRRSSCSRRWRPAHRRTGSSRGPSARRRCKSRRG